MVPFRSNAVEFRKSGDGRSYVRAGSYADCILKGEKPDNLALQTPAKYQLVEVAMPLSKKLGLYRRI
jgi:hypothetical protein